jgi:hypothetical protein
MKVFRITTEVEVIKTIQYIVEAESKEEVIAIITKGKERGEGEEIKEKYNWKSENITDSTFIENLK